MNADVESKANEYLKKLNVNDMLFILRNMEESNLLRFAARPTYEVLIASYLVEGKPPLFRRALQAKGHSEDTLFAPKLASAIETVKVSFHRMKLRTLYKPEKDNFSFADIYYKDRIVEDKPDDAMITIADKGVNVKVRNLKFVGINPSTGTSTPSKKRVFTSFPALKKELNLPDNLLVDFLICPHPEVASFSTATVVGVPKGTVMKISILIAPDFERR